MTISEILSVLRKTRGGSFAIYVPKNVIRAVLKICGRTDLWSRITGDLVVDTSKFEAPGLASGGGHRARARRDALGREGRTRSQNAAGFVMRPPQYAGRLPAADPATPPCHLH